MTGLAQYLELMAGADPVVYIVIVVFILALSGWVWWSFKGHKAKPRKKVSVVDNADSYEAISGGIKQANVEQVQLGTGDVKCLCFRKIKGVNVADFTTIPNAIGEMYQFDPSVPLKGSGFIVKQLDDGSIVDYDPREVPFIVKESPEYAYFATNWDILKSVFFVPTSWYKSTAVWFAAAVLVIVFITGLAVLG